MNRIAHVLHIQPGEEQRVALLAAQLFFLGTAFVLTQTAAFALYLATFGAAALPYAYLATAVLVSLVSFAYLRLAGRLPLARLLQVNVAFLLLTSLVLWLGLEVVESRVLIFIMPAWFQCLVNLGNIALWSLAGRLFDVREGKRLFGVVGGGNWVATTVGGLLVPLVVPWVGTPNLLLIATVGLAVALALQAYTLRAYAPRLAPVAVGPQAAEPPSLAPLFRNRYVLLILALIVAWWVGFFIIDSIFYALAAARFPDADQLASFLGIFVAVIGVLALVITTLVTGPLLNRYGIRAGLMTMPTALTVGIAGVAIAGLIGGLAVAVFWLAAITKLLNVTLGFSVEQSALVVLYQPLPPGVRVRVQALAEGIVQPLAVGLAGLLLLAFGYLLSFTPVQMAWVFLIVAAVWLPVALLLTREYGRAVTHALAERKLRATVLDLSGPETRAALRAGLDDPNPDAALYALSLLQKADAAAAPAVLPQLLSHPAAQVRQRALEEIRQGEVVSALPVVKQLAESDPSPLVRGTAVRTLAALGDAGDPRILTYLDDPAPSVQRGALVALTCCGRPEDAAIAQARLARLARSPDAADRALAADAIAEGIPDAAGHLAALLADTDAGVRRAALRACVTVDDPDLWPVVVEALGHPETRGAATAALTAAGDHAVPYVDSLFDRPGISSVTRVDLATVCGRVRSGSAAAVLARQVAQPDPRVRDAVLAGLNACGYHADAVTGAAVREQVLREVQAIGWMQAALTDLGHGDATGVLRDGLRAAQGQARERVLLLLACLDDREAVLRARDALKSSQPEQRAYALEALDTRLPHDLRPALSAVDASEAAARRLASLYPQPSLGRDGRLCEIIQGQGETLTPWLHAAALYAVGQLKATACREAVETATASNQPLVRETAEWAMGQLAGNVEGGKPMRSTIEKAIILKNAPLFAGTTDDMLAAVAALMTEVDAPADTAVIRKGEPGDSMYVIVSGKMRVHDGDYTLNHLNAGEVFGEMALLDPEPRVASVTAVEDTRLLRLDREPFEELIADHIEVAREVIRMLTARIRGLVQQTAALNAQLQAEERGE